VQGSLEVLQAFERAAARSGVDCDAGVSNWTFVSLNTLSPAQYSVADFRLERTNYNFDTSKSGNYYDQSPVQEADLWCALNPSRTEDERGKMFCTSLLYFMLYPGTVASELVAKTPVDRIFNRPEVNPFPDTTSVTLRYHDLAAENRAAITETSAQNEKRFPCPADAVRIYVDDKNGIILNGKDVATKDLSKLLRALTPSPKRVCFALAASSTGTSSNAIEASMDAWRLGLPFALYGDAGFTEPVQLK